MNKLVNIHGWILALCLMSFAGAAQARFFKDMTALQVSQEVTVQLLAGKNIDTVAKAAHEAGLLSAQIASSLIQAGQKPVAVVSTVVSMDPLAAAPITAAALAINPAQAGVITAAAIAAAPEQSGTIVATALTVPKVDPSQVMPATAAGGDKNQAERR
ncbi:MAG: hypothetical protein HY016_10015 [Nitrosomonadales bacterium]|nr:hypothetical protein [Nitrosomonadales bacterium]